jgi:alkanesulfonate monooxygenase SsuD/methylene tetrahydromethanopterin reductase-like flavin-dependent oxidoreductase (luciferase family)
VRGGDTGNRVPLVVAANGPKSIRLAVERGDGWMTYGGVAGTDEEWWGLVARQVRVVDDALDAQRRERHALDRYLNFDAAPTYVLSSVGAFEDAVGRAAELGFTDVITQRPRPTDPFRGTRDLLDEVAADVIPRLR